MLIFPEVWWLEQNFVSALKVLPQSSPVKRTLFQIETVDLEP
jgi:hypothetical protein